MVEHAIVSFRNHLVELLLNIYVYTHRLGCSQVQPEKLLFAMGTSHG